MNIIKFTGKTKAESMRKAMRFYYDNLDNGVELFLARCRVQSDGTTIVYYPNLQVDLEKYRKFKAEKKGIK